MIFIKLEKISVFIILKRFLFLLCFCLILQSCEEDQENLVKSRRDLLTQSTWKVNKVLVDDKQNPDTDLALIGLKANFSNSGTYSFTKNGTQSGVWRFSADEEAVLFDSVRESNDTWIILSLENKKFEASYRENNESIRLFLIPN